MNSFFPILVVSALVGMISYTLFPYLHRWARRVLRDSLLGRFERASSTQRVNFVFYTISFITLVFMWARVFYAYASFQSWYEVLWNIDRVLVGLLRGDSVLPYLADRYNPIIVAFVPLYALWSDPRVLLPVQSAGLALAALPIYWYARQRLGRSLGFCVGVAYLFSLPLFRLNSADLFELKFSVPLLAFTMFFLLRQRYIPFIVSLGLALLVKEDIALIALGFAAFIAFVQRRRAFGLALGALGVGLPLLVTEWLYPTFHAGRPFYLWAERYAYLGNTLGQIAWALVTRPWIAIQHVLSPSRIDYVLYLAQLLVGISLLGIEVTAIALLPLLFGLLSEWPQQSDPSSYYQAPLIPILFFGAIIGMGRVLKWRALEPGNRTRFALIVFVVAGALVLPNTWTRVLNPDYFSISGHDALGHQLIERISAGATVVTQTEFVTWLYHARQYRVRHLTPLGDYREADYVFGDTARPWYGYRQAVWEHWRASGYFEPVAEQDGYFLLRRTPLIYPGRQFDNGWALLGYTAAPNTFNQPLGLRFENGMTLLNYAAVPSDKIQRGEKLRVIVEWQADKDIAARHIVLARLADARGHVWSQVDHAPIIPTERWKSGDLIRDQYNFDLPRFMPPGNYRVTIGVWDAQAEKSVTIADASGRALGIEAVICEVPVEKDATEFPVSYLQIEIPYRAEMGDLTLLGATAIPRSSKAGEEILIGLYWQARVKPQRDYWVGFQLLDQTGQVVLEQVGAPAGSAYPTSLWSDKEIVLDWHDLALPHSLSLGSFSLAVIARRDDGMELGRATIATIAIIR